MNQLSVKIALLIEQARQQVARASNTTMVQTYFAIGRLLVEDLQEGELRAEYGAELLKQISTDLSTTFGKGYSVQNLERMRSFYSVYAKSSNDLRNSDVIRKSSNALRIFIDEQKTINLLPLSWSHYLFLIRIENEAERQFYEIEAYRNQWILKELERQFNSGLYERLLLSKDKDAVFELATNGQLVANPNDLLKEPLVLEFLGLREETTYSETELETAIINQLEMFMLELGKGFFFGGRQVRFTFDEEHFFVDLVFYNRLLRCFVLIDLKIGKLKHQDMGQMQMYVNYYDRFVKQEDENPTIGFVICKYKNEAIVELTLPSNNQQLFAAKYQTVLPSKEILKRLIEEQI
mgnify:CR=1 FL=1